ncbi:hypothetical protein CR513_28131, partial [Mucuna pruriens]
MVTRIPVTKILEKVYEVYLTDKQPRKAFKSYLPMLASNMLDAGEAVSTIVYVLNKCLTKRLEELVPEEVWTMRKPNVRS